MDALLNSGLLNLFAVTVTATGGVFLVVVLSGLLSALLTLGSLELFFRARIQRSVLRRYIRGALNRYSPHVALAGIPVFYDFLAQRYASVQELESYIAQLGELNGGGDLLPALAKMEPSTFYQLHYRQLCGQLAAVIANEGLRVGNPHLRTPLSDFLAFIAESRGEMIAESSPAPATGVEPAENESRYRLELALRQVDVIQAELGNQINKTVYGYTSGGWTLFYLIVLLASWVNFSLHGGGLLATGWELAQKVVLVTFVLLAAALMALGTAVFSAVAFTWLDRTFAAK